MPRVGRNPMKFAGKAYVPQQVTLVTAVHIPELAGYWAESLDVLKVCLQSVQQNTTVPYDLLVFDNGSCQEVRDYLQTLYDDGAIQFLMLSRENVGKVGCWNIAFPAAPGEYIAWFDSDVLFAPGWLEESLKVFEAFENVGMVTARPGRLPALIDDDLRSSTLDYARRTAHTTTIETGDLVPRAVLAEHFRSLGVPEDTIGFPETDVKLARDGTSVYAYASHFQFVARRSCAVQVLPLQPGQRPLLGDREWDVRMNQLGLLRVSLEQPYVRHIGNSLRGENVCAAFARAPEAAAPEGRAGNARNGVSRLLARGVARRIAVRVYGVLGKMLYPGA